ncbi:hypothetical protein [Carnimonas bestiolae]|uniref:hypothetical protein n=1 Tax=Carnimonas bestiolae TaxID=3402172 RepID=UPI003EDB8911
MLKLVKVDRKPLPESRGDLIFLSECFYIARMKRYGKEWALRMYQDHYGLSVSASDAQLALDDHFLTNRAPSYCTWGWFNVSPCRLQEP